MITLLTWEHVDHLTICSHAVGEAHHSNKQYCSAGREVRVRRPALCRHCGGDLTHPNARMKGIHATCAQQPVDENGVCFHATCRCPGSPPDGGCCQAHRKKVEK